MRLLTTAAIITLGALITHAAPPAKLAFVEEKLCSMENAIQTYLNHDQAWNHKHLKNFFAQIGGRDAPRLIHEIDDHIVFVNRRKKENAGDAPAPFDDAGRPKAGAAALVEAFRG